MFRLAVNVCVCEWCWCLMLMLVGTCYNGDLWGPTLMYDVDSCCYWLVLVVCFTMMLADMLGRWLYTFDGRCSNINDLSRFFLDDDALVDVHGWCWWLMTMRIDVDDSYWWSFMVLAVLLTMLLLRTDAEPWWLIVHDRLLIVDDWRALIDGWSCFCLFLINVFFIW